jgi:hypothetical protein
MSVAQIVEGTLKNMFNIDEELSKERLKICKKCPLYKVEDGLGAICSHRLYINNEDKISKTPKIGYVKGCGCLLRAKTRVNNAVCVINK